MKRLLLYTLLLGMALIHIPRSLLHKCEYHEYTCAHHEHTFDHHEDHDEDGENKDLSFESDKCELCTYAFHALEKPSTDLIRVPDVPFSIESSFQAFSIRVLSVEGILLRGPPNSFSLS